MSNKSYPLLSVYGIEIEYMIVDKDTLNVLPICDKVLTALGGAITNEVSLGKIAASNELALHVIELKTNGPTPSLKSLDHDFFEAIKKIESILDSHNARLMPTGMHPWFEPDAGFCLWPHGDKTIYNTYHRIFNCSGHGWSNLQSTHINLPFANDEEFAKLHSAIRYLLPLIPALTASTPFMQGKSSGVIDSRLEFYGKNQQKIPSIAGEVVPEFVTSRHQYETQILFPMYQAIHSHDPDKVLQEEWLNSRGAIARFDRDAIEIRIMDSQECPTADIACVNFIAEVLRLLIQKNLELLNDPIETSSLKTVYLNCIEKGMEAMIDDKKFLALLGYTTPATAKILWADLFKQVEPNLDEAYIPTIKNILNHGNLSERLIKAYTDEKSMKPLYEKLCRCLSQNESFYA